VHRDSSPLNIATVRPSAGKSHCGTGSLPAPRVL
jgi:hypothetical protein